MKRLNPTKKEREKLEQAHKNIVTKKNVEYPFKILSVLFYIDFNSITKVASHLRVDRKTVRTYVQKYVSQGIDGLMSDNYVPYTGKLTGSEKTNLSSHLEEVSYPTTKEIKV